MNAVISDLRADLFEAKWAELCVKLNRLFSRVTNGQQTIDKVYISPLIEIFLTITAVLSLVEAHVTRRDIFMALTGLMAYILDFRTISKHHLQILGDFSKRFSQVVNQRWNDMRLVQPGCVDDWDSLRFILHSAAVSPNFSLPLVARIVTSMIEVSRSPLMTSLHFESLTRDIVHSLACDSFGISVLATLFQKQLFPFEVIPSLDTIEKTLSVGDLLSIRQASIPISSTFIETVSDCHVLLKHLIGTIPESYHPDLISSPLIEAILCDKSSLDTAIKCLKNIPADPDFDSRYPRIDKRLQSLTNSWTRHLVDKKNSDTSIREFLLVLVQFRRLTVTLVVKLRYLHQSLPVAIARGVLETILPGLIPQPKENDLVESVCLIMDQCGLDIYRKIEKILADDSPWLLCLSSDRKVACDIATFISFPVVNQRVRKNCAAGLETILCDQAQTTLIVSQIYDELVLRAIQVAENNLLVEKTIDLVGGSIAPRNLIKLILSADSAGRWWCLVTERVLHPLIKSESLKSATDIREKIPDVNRLLSFSQRLDLIHRIYGAKKSSPIHLVSKL